MPYPSTYPPSAADPDTVDLAGRRCPRLTSPSEVARRLAELDEAYIRAEFSVLDQLAADRPGGPHEARRQIASGWLPQPAYRLDDGTEMIPVDYFDPVDKAGGVGQLHSWFREEYIRAAGALNLPVDDATVADSGTTTCRAGMGFACATPAPPGSLKRRTTSHVSRSW